MNRRWVKGMHLDPSAVKTGPGRRNRQVVTGGGSEKGSAGIRQPLGSGGKYEVVLRPKTRELFHQVSSRETEADLTEICSSGSLMNGPCREGT